ncbi:gamete and mating-type specific protein A [Heterostelium album PN500]|uniref:Gamete and mating-type specific protein A n=1 Tax=Heterostelium pallidum (strain ATCC 26659 / Pp 5 / PN500) TaxID=670386 RepID=D3BTA5_HETP5|nr:gamete and mating-type specific protein A [Heterostelium album PN500]EFA75322.1 gamete and mating-type specific protein A [Heterostelium album PN500]|eukprot:XP_020427456.1 gamete and mating-type specific protein A [Heterostelium album PN500]
MSKIVLLNLFIIIFTSLVVGQFTNDELQTVIAYHNYLRTYPSPPSATPLTPLTYDQGIADILNKTMSTCSGWSPIAMQGTGSEWQYWWNPASAFSVASQMDMIAEQSFNYDWNVLNCQENTVCLPWLYIVWSSVSKYGCAKAICNGQAHMGCTYQSQGGFDGVAPYQVKVTPTPTPTQTPTPTSTPSSTPSQTPTQTPTQTPSPSPSSTPKSDSLTIDWRNGYVTPIRNQGNCGSCWAFGSVAAMESRYLIKNGNSQVSTLDLSEQNAVSCLPNGCEGGWINKVFDAFQSPGIAYESDNPYLAEDGQPCSYTSPNNHPRFFFNGYGSTSNSKDELINELQNGPVTVGLWVDDSFQLYSSGIFTCSQVYTTTNHVVLVVGYNQEQDYYIIKNSWSTQWGNSGYMYLSAANDNCCMLTYGGYYPTF